MKLEKGFTLTGEELTFLSMSFAKGKSYFESLGYSQCRNKRFFEKNGNHAHFNAINKIWIIEVK